MSEIKAQCIDQALIFLNTPTISSGNVNYDTISFDFCSRWDGYIKTAIFYRTKDEAYYQILDNDSCIIPKEVLKDKGVIYIGVFGTLGDKTITSQVLQYRIQEGALTEDLIPADPTPDIYAQLIDLYDQILKNQSEFISAQEKTMSDYHTEWTETVETTRNEMIAEVENTREEMVNEVEEIIKDASLGDARTLNGKTEGELSVADSAKLGGKGASEYALVSQLFSKIESYANLDFNTAITTKIYTNNAPPSNVNASNYPTNTTGILAVFGGGTFGAITQYYVTYYGTIYTRSKFHSMDWSEWDSNANYFKNTGGDITGDIRQIIGTNSTIMHRLANLARVVTLGIYEGGLFRLYDNTNGKDIINSTADGTNTFNGTASGCLPLSGGTVGSGNSSGEPLALDSSTSFTLLKYLINGSLAGYLGFDGIDSPVFSSASGGSPKKLLHSGNVGDYALPKNGGGTVTNSTTTVMQLKNSSGERAYLGYVGSNTLGYLGFEGTDTPSFVTKAGAVKNLLHTGNSAKVLVQSTPLTAEGSVRVW